MLKCIFLFFIEWFHIMLTVLQINIRFEILPYMINKNDLHWLLIFMGVDRQWYCLLTRLWYIYYLQYFMCLWLYYATLRNHIKYSVCFLFHTESTISTSHTLDRASTKRKTNKVTISAHISIVQYPNLKLTVDLKFE